MSERKQYLCECGCGQFAYFNQLDMVRINEAVDESLRTTKVRATFYVRHACKKAFLDELALQTLLKLLLDKHAQGQFAKPWLYRLNVWNTFRRWRWRIRDSVKVLRLTHAIYERNKGFDYARRRAIRSAVLFAAPRFMAGWLIKVWRPLLEDKKAPPVLPPGTAFEPLPLE